MRIVTRGDFDSLISTVLLSLSYDIDDVKISHPAEIQECKFEITSNDILANLPYHSDCGYWFDHHINEDHVANEIEFQGCFKVAPSCSRVIFDYCENIAETRRFEKVVEVADQIDSASLSIEAIKNPHGWFIIDRTLSAFDPKGTLGDFREYFIKLVHWIKTSSLSSILMSDDVQHRIEHVRSEHKLFINALRECSNVDQNVIITDSRSLRYFPNGNRFLIYSLYPNQNVSISIFNRRGTDQSVLFCGHNIFNRGCKTDINELMHKYHGSGRMTAGSCVVPSSDADSVLNEIVSILKTNG
ncbi:MAG: hypothetical protein D8M58_00835 [Calditrichaeota bacterium]|nr:MAG: hypothetical protein DWQ03_06245 [Calditrichota bacterium]MBL1203912.1 hypothetical protein [Calditrichota bacterium]NOG43745.1 hypothetical protein [Calditrichota bacterium]